MVEVDPFERNTVASLCKDAGIDGPDGILEFNPIAATKSNPHAYLQSSNPLTDSNYDVLRNHCKEFALHTKTWITRRFSI